MKNKEASVKLGKGILFGDGIDGHWITGYGYVGTGPGNDNSNFDWEHKDSINIYIAILATGGL